MLSQNQPDNDNLRLHDLKKRLEANITEYTKKDYHLLSADNRVWNIIKLMEILNDADTSPLKMASRVLEHITSGLFTTGFFSKSKLRDSLLKTLHLTTPELFKPSHEGFSTPLSETPELNVQSAVQIGTVESLSVNFRPSREDDAKRETNELKELLLSLNQILSEYLQNKYPGISHRNRALNIKLILDVITIPVDGFKGFKYYTANEVALRLHEHLSSQLFKKGYYGSILQNRIYAEITKHSDYLAKSWWDKSGRARFLLDTDLKHRALAAIRVMTQYNKELLTKIESVTEDGNEVVKRYKDLAITIPQLKTLITDCINLINTLKRDTSTHRSMLITISDELRQQQRIITELQTATRVQNQQQQNIMNNLSPIETYLTSLRSTTQPLENFDWDEHINDEVTLIGRTRPQNLEDALHEHHKKERDSKIQIDFLNKKIQALEEVIALYEQLEKVDETELLDDEKSLKDEKEFSHSEHQSSRIASGLGHSGYMFSRNRPDSRINDDGIELEEFNSASTTPGQSP
jgi:hypothetical protein